MSGVLTVLGASLKNDAPAAAAPVPREPYTIDYVIVAGGGGGGASTFQGAAGGGGGGGVVSGSFTAIIGTPYQARVGGGGAGSPAWPNNGSNGTPSFIDSNSPSFNIATATGGGGGGSVGPGVSSKNNGSPGGSGGGGSSGAARSTPTAPFTSPGAIGGSGTPGQGNIGGPGASLVFVPGTPAPRGYVGGGGGGGGAGASGIGGSTGSAGPGGSYATNGGNGGNGGTGVDVPFAFSLGRFGGGGGGAAGQGPGKTPGGQAPGTLSPFVNKGAGGPGSRPTGSGTTGNSGTVFFSMPFGSYSGNHGGSPAANYTVSNNPPDAPGKTVVQFISTANYVG